MAFEQRGSGVNPEIASIEAVMRKLTADPNVTAALRQIGIDETWCLEQQARITAIPSPPFKESQRANYYLARMRELGLPDASLDAEGNVIGLRKGAAGRPRLVLSAHLDTVFPEGTKIEVRHEDGKVHAPGIGDDGRGLAVVLAVLRTLVGASLDTVGDVVFVGTVGEEGLGDLRGAKAFHRDHPMIDGFISVDELGVNHIVNQASGSRRYKITFSGPGGHSYDDFGNPSAVHAMSRAIARIADIETPSQPKTTFTVGRAEGGTSVNAIAGHAEMLLDLRSSDPEALGMLQSAALPLIDEAVAAENMRWKSDKLTFEIEPIGDRPPGSTAENSTIVQAARCAVLAVAPQTDVKFIISSTDANVFMSHGIPAVTVGGGGEGGGGHTEAEWFKPTDSHLGPQSVLLLVLALAGLRDVTDPLLKARS